MFGSGIGELNVYVRNGESVDSKIWGLSGDAGNNWYMGQAPIASSSTFKVSHPFFFVSLGIYTLHVFCLGFRVWGHFYMLALTVEIFYNQAKNF